MGLWSLLVNLFRQSNLRGVEDDNWWLPMLAIEVFVLQPYAAYEAARRVPEITLVRTRKCTEELQLRSVHCHVGLGADLS